MSSSLNEVPTPLAGFVHITRDKLQILMDLTYSRILGPGRRREPVHCQLGYQASDDASFSLPASHAAVRVSVVLLVHIVCQTQDSEG